MKKYTSLIFVLLFSTAPYIAADVKKNNVKVEEAGADLYLLDKLEAVAHTQEGTEIVTLSDTRRPNLGGGIRSRDEILFEKIVFLDAKKYKIMPGEEEIDKYLAVVQRENNLTLEDLKGIFSQAGYTFEEGREEFRRMQAVNSMFDFKIRQNVIVPRKDIEAYYHEHPEKKEASYLLEYSTVPFVADKEKEEQKKQLERVAKTYIGIADIAWSEPFWINHSEISEDKSSIFDLAAGDVSMPQEAAEGFELYRLKDKKEEHLLTFDERYQDIAEILRQPKFQELMQNYRDALFDSASILYFD